MDTLEGLRRKLGGAEDLKSVVRTMKAMAASNIGQYETAVNSLEDYYRTMALGIAGYFSANPEIILTKTTIVNPKKEKHICAIVFGSDQGLVGQFNDSLSEYVSQSLQSIPGTKEIWAVGERVQVLLQDSGFVSTKRYPVPISVNAITPLISQLLLESEKNQEDKTIDEFYVFHNQPKAAASYEPMMLRLLPFDEEWKTTLANYHWPTKLKPQVVGAIKPTLLALVHGFLFVSLYKACAESLASENSSRLAAMQRAEKNISELLEQLAYKFHSLRQSLIDEELFDVVSGFEALKEDSLKKK